MPIHVDPTIKNPTHHVSLEDSQGNIVGLNIINDEGIIDPLAITGAPIDRSATKTFQGNQEYSDLEAPWSPIAQSSWEGGGLSEDYDNDTSRFLWNRRVNPSIGKLMLGPRDTYTKGYRSMDFSLPGSVKWKSIYGANTYVAKQFTASANYDAKYIYLHLKRNGSVEDDLTVALYDDNSGAVGSLLQSATITPDDFPDLEAEFYRVEITAESLTASTDYWVVVTAANGEEDTCWMIGADNSTSTTKSSSDGSSWSDALFDLYFMVTDADDVVSHKFFTYKRATYAIINPVSGAPTIYINGDRGVADANTGALGTLVDATKSWTTDVFVGSVVVVIGGTGSTERRNYRVITANTGTVLTVDTPWLIEHDTTTEYVILGSNVWTLVASHGITGPVLDLTVVNNIVYFALGESINMRRMQWTAASGHEWADDGTNKASALCYVYDATDGLTLWRGNNGATPSVSKETSLPAWGVDITFATAINMKDEYGKIVSMIPYGDPEVPWVLREGMIFYISADKVIKIKLDEIRTVMDTNNGQAVTATNVYLVFNLGASIQQYYNSELDDIGPNRESGMPQELQGIPEDMLAYPGKIYAAINAGPDRISSVIMRYGNGWAELYRAPVAGQEITGMSFQPVPGDTPDRLFIGVGDHIVSLCHPSNVNDPSKDSEYEFVHEGSLTTGYMYASMFDVEKIFNTVKVFATGLSDEHQIIKIDYQLDDDTEWTEMSEDFVTSPSQEVDIDSDGFGVNAKRIRLRIRLLTDDKNLSPQIKATVVEGVYRVAVKYSYSFAVRAEDAEYNMRVDRDDMLEANDKAYLLKQWASTLTPLKMRCIYQEYDDKRVFIDPYPSRPTKVNSEAYYLRLIVVEL
jgi:hypothetical protein